MGVFESLRHRVVRVRDHDQMHMIGHEAVGMHLPVRLLARFGQGFDEVLPVNIVGEYPLLPVAAAHHMIHGTRILNAQFAWHSPRGNVPQLYLSIEKRTKLILLKNPN